MRTLTLYTPRELKEKFPEAYDRAFDKFKTRNIDYIPWSEEIHDSLMAIFEFSGITVKDFEYGAYCRNTYIQFQMGEETRELHMGRAMAWLENNLYSRLRIPWNHCTKILTHKATQRNPARWTNRRELAKFGKYYRPDMIRPCPFTGVCFDEDFIDDLNKSIRDGHCLGDAFKNLVYRAEKLLQAEEEYLYTEEYFLDQDYAEYEEDGSKI